MYVFQFKSFSTTHFHEKGNFMGNVDVKTIIANVFEVLITLLATCFMLLHYLAYFSILKKKATYYSEISVGFQRNTFFVFNNTEISLLAKVYES
jgi:hypothetical protein